MNEDLERQIKNIFQKAVQENPLKAPSHIVTEVLATLNLDKNKRTSGNRDSHDQRAKEDSHDQYSQENSYDINSSLS